MITFVIGLICNENNARRKPHSSAIMLTAQNSPRTYSPPRYTLYVMEFYPWSAVAEWVRSGGQWFESHCGNLFASELWAYPALPVYFGGDSKSRRSLLSGVYARGSKRPHQSALECGIVVDYAAHSKFPRNASMRLKTLPCTEKEDEEEEAHVMILITLFPTRLPP